MLRYTFKTNQGGFPGDVTEGMRIDCVSPIRPLCGMYKSARGRENPLTTGGKQAVPCRTGREAWYLPVSAE